MYIQISEILGISVQESLFKKALHSVPKSGEVWCEGARLAIIHQKYEEAYRYLLFSISFTPQYGDSFIELCRWKLLTKGISANTSKIERLCVNASPNYGMLWMHYKSSCFDTPREIFLNAKKSIISQLLSVSKQRIKDSNFLFNKENIPSNTTHPLELLSKKNKENKKDTQVFTLKSLTNLLPSDNNKPTQSQSITSEKESSKIPSRYQFMELFQFDPKKNENCFSFSEEQQTEEEDSQHEHHEFSSTYHSSEHSEYENHKKELSPRESVSSSDFEYSSSESNSNSPVSPKTFNLLGSSCKENLYERWPFSLNEIEKPNEDLRAFINEWKRFITINKSNDLESKIKLIFLSDQLKN